MEAETYLSSGYGIRRSIEARVSGWQRFGEVARVWMPGRLKGIQVQQEYGIPFLAATQFFDIRPVPRKWLSIERTHEATRRFVRQGMIVVTCSGSVGRPTLAYSVHEGTLISHDLLRVEPIEERDAGWIYGFLHSSQARAMSRGIQYGHIIKHLESAHLEALPIPRVDGDVALEFEYLVSRIIALRNDSHERTLEAEKKLTLAIGELAVSDWGEAGFVVDSVGELAHGRRRLDAGNHNPGVAEIWRHLARFGKGFTSISSAGFEVWLPNRFRRVPAEDGVLLVSSADLTEVNPDSQKRIADGDFGDPYRGRVKDNWIVMARSGQAYGIIGSAILVGKDLEGKVISDDAIRIMPQRDARIRSGYLLTAITHPLFGRPLIKSLVYGSSIPHLDIVDIKEMQIVRLERSVENDIADCAESAAMARAEADVLEGELASRATQIVNTFIRGLSL